MCTTRRKKRDKKTAENKTKQNLPGEYHGGHIFGFSTDITKQTNSTDERIFSVVDGDFSCLFTLTIYNERLQ